jgi:hypothetical protein
MVGEADKLVAIFHHASFFEYQRDNPLLFPGLITQTLSTLALLFIKHEKKETNRWLQALPFSSLRVTRYLMRCKKLLLEIAKSRHPNFGMTGSSLY